MLSKATVVAVVGTIAAASGVAIERSANERGGADPPGNAAMTGRRASGGATSAGESASGPSDGSRAGVRRRRCELERSRVGS